MFQSIISALKHYSKTTPERQVVIDDESSITYKQLYSKVCFIADYLLKKGLKKGDCVIIKALQDKEYIAALHAIQMIGAIAVPLEKNVKEARVATIKKETNAKVFISTENIESIETILYSDLKNQTLEEEPCELPTADDYSTILFTTGTTGKSKGILLSHRSDVATAENVFKATKLKVSNVEIIPMPMNHSFSLRRYYANVLAGACVVLLDGVVFVNKFFEALEKHSATAVAMAPSALSILFKLSKDKIANYADQIDYMQFGGAHFPKPDKEKLCKLLPNARLYDFYGSTEAGCSCTMNFNSNEIKPFRLGKATVNSQIEFVNEDNEIVQTNEENPARLVTSGKIVMDEYLNEPELTSQTLVNGYVFSNDLGYKDKDGWVYVLGRFDDVIVTGGNKVAPSEVEDMAIKFDSVFEAACVPMEDKLMGQVPKLFVVATEDFNEAEFRQFLTQRLESFQVPKVIRIIEEIPKTYNGKILKRELINL